MKLFGDSIKAKVVIGFGIALSLVVFATYLTYASFTQLLQSVDTLSEPNKKLHSLQHTLATISAAESSIRAYTLTTKEEHLKTYLNHLDSIKGQIDTLEALMINSPSELAHVDSISTLLEKKQQSLQNFIALKKEQQNLDLSGKAMRQIASTAERKPLSTIIKQNTTTTISDRLTLKSNGDVDENYSEEEEEDRGFFDKIFSRKEKNKNQLQGPPEVLVPEINVTHEVKVDTNRAATSVAPLAKVRRILHDVQREAEEKAEQLQVKELALLHQDKQIMDQIRSMMYELERNELEQSIENSARAKIVARDTSLVLLLIGIAGLGGGAAFILLILRDISRSNIYRSNLIKAQKEAVQLARAKEAFVANMSHEMRTPLNVILGFTQQLKHTSLQVQQQQHIQAINGAGQHLLHIVNDVLDLSKIEAGKLRINTAPFSLQQMLTEVSQVFQLKASSKNIAFHCQIGPDMPDALIGDALRIKQVLFNLVDNAIKFTHEGQVNIDVKLTSIRRRRVVTKITVSDTGIGISKDKIQHVFGEFNQADDSILRRYGGTGLGLSISKKLVEIQGGTLTVTSEYGEGTAFTLTLPLYVSQQEEIVAPSTDEAPAQDKFKGLTALIIDDDAYSRTLGSLILSRWGMHVHLANDGQEAIALVKEHKFDVVLTDIQLPGVNGKTVARAIRKYDREVPVLAVSANILSNDPDFFKGSTISGHLLKPFTELELYQKLQEALGDGNIKMNQTVESTQLNNEETTVGTHLYNLYEMRLFIGDDNNTLAAVIEVLIKEQQENLANLTKTAKDGDWNNVAEVAHKMLTAFKHLQAHTVTPGLEKLEQVIHHPNSMDQDLPETVTETAEQANQVLIALERELVQLKKKAEQGVTS